MLQAGDMLLCRMGVVNTGEAVWLSRAKWEKGEVRLRWRWFEAGQEGQFTQGGWLLGYSILPGQSYEFTVEIAGPKKPGHYILEFTLVSEGVTSFADQGTAPLRLSVWVTALPSRG
jgi:hypothetical protein